MSQLSFFIVLCISECQAKMLMLQSEERVPARPRPSRRSKSEGPPQSEYRLQYMKFRGDPCEPDEDRDMVGKACPHVRRSPSSHCMQDHKNKASSIYSGTFPLNY